MLGPELQLIPSATPDQLEWAEKECNRCVEILTKWIDDRFVVEGTGAIARYVVRLDGLKDKIKTYSQIYRNPAEAAGEWNPHPCDQEHWPPLFTDFWESIYNDIDSFLDKFNKLCRPPLHS